MAVFLPMVMAYVLIVGADKYIAHEKKLEQCQKQLETKQEAKK